MTSAEVFTPVPRPKPGDSGNAVARDSPLRRFLAELMRHGSRQQEPRE
jgi:hypothetical protein